MEKYVYFDKSNYYFEEIKEEYLESTEKFKNYFGYIDSNLDDNNEIIIYKLVKHKVFKKDINYKFI